MIQIGTVLTLLAALFGGVYWNNAPEHSQLPPIVGVACQEDGDCGSQGICLGQPKEASATVFSAGYCTFFDCHHSECPMGSECIFIEETGSYLCLASCVEGASCRSGYACQQGVCLPK